MIKQISDDTYMYDTLFTYYWCKGCLTLNIIIFTLITDVLSLTSKVITYSLCLIETCFINYTNTFHSEYRRCDPICTNIMSVITCFDNVELNITLKVHSTRKSANHRYQSMSVKVLFIVPFEHRTDLSVHKVHIKHVLLL